MAKMTLAADIFANTRATIGARSEEAAALEAKGFATIKGDEATITAAGIFAMSKAQTEVPPASAGEETAAEKLQKADRKRRKAPPVKETEDDKKVSAPLFNGTAEELLQHIQRIEQLSAEKSDLNDQVKEIFAEAKGRGFDTKAIRRVIAIRKMKPQEWQESQAILDVYLTAVGIV